MTVMPSKPGSSTTPRSSTNADGSARSYAKAPRVSAAEKDRYLEDLEATFKRNVAAEMKRRAENAKPEASMLGSLGVQIRRHWLEHRPKMAAELQTAGKLDAAVYAAEQLTLDAEATAIRNGMAPDQARELTRGEWAFLPCEEDVPALPNGDPAGWVAPPSPDSTSARPMRMR